LRTYRGSIEKHIRPKLGRVRVSDLDVDRVARFLADMRKEDLAAWTIHGTLTPLSAMLNYAARRGYVGSNPVKQLTKHERPKDFNKPMRILSSEEIAAVLRASTDTYRLLLMTAIFSGLRVGELLRLKWLDIDWNDNLLIVRSSKTEAGVREVAIPDFLVQELSRASLDLDGGEYVFRTKDGEPMKHRTVARRALEATLKRAKVPHCRFHDLRHTYASILIGQGDDVTYVAAQMGHSTPAITLNVYAKLFDPVRRRKESRAKLQEAFAAVVA
jgi:integrase